MTLRCVAAACPCLLPALPTCQPALPAAVCHASWQCNCLRYTSPSSYCCCYLPLTSHRTSAVLPSLLLQDSAKSAAEQAGDTLKAGPGAVVQGLKDLNNIQVPGPSTGAPSPLYDNNDKIRP